MDSNLVSENSQYFYIYELTVSRDYPRIANSIRVSIRQKLNAKLLVESCLHSIRLRFGSVKPLSWVRSLCLNVRVGGSPHSDHFSGGAVDFFCTGDMLGVYKWIFNHKLPIRQCIYYWDKNFIHLSINLPTYGKDYKNEFLIQDKNGLRPFY